MRLCHSAPCYASWATWEVERLQGWVWGWLGESFMFVAYGWSLWLTSSIWYPSRYPNLGTLDQDSSWLPGEDHYSSPTSHPSWQFLEEADSFFIHAIWILCFHLILFHSCSISFTLAVAAFSLAADFCQSLSFSRSISSRNLTSSSWAPLSNSACFSCSRKCKVSSFGTVCYSPLAPANFTQDLLLGTGVSSVFSSPDLRNIHYLL